MKLHRFAVFALVCAGGCPGDGGGATGPTPGTSTAEPATEGTPTTSQGDPSSATEPALTTGTGPGTETVAGTDTSTATEASTATSADTGASTAGPDTDTGVSAGTTAGGTTATETTTGDETESTTGETTAEPMPGSLECEAIEFGEPIVVDQFFGGTGFVEVAPIAIAWRSDLVLARATYQSPECPIWWEHRDDDGQLVGEKVEIPIPLKGPDTSPTCQQISDIVWDPGHQRYIYMHPRHLYSGTYEHLPVAITPAGELAWISDTDETIRSMSFQGVRTELRIVGDELYVMGSDAGTLNGWKPRANVYDATDGAFIRTVQPAVTAAGAAITCDETCTTGVVTGRASTGEMYMWQFDMTVATPVAGKILLTEFPVDYASPGLLIPRGADDFLSVTYPRIYQDGDYISTNTLGLDVGWTGQEHQDGVGGEFFESWWAATDDGYAVVSTNYPLTSSLLPEDYKQASVRLWNIGHDGAIREQAILPDIRDMSPRIAYKAGRLAITYVHRDLDGALDSRRLIFASCPR